MTLIDQNWGPYGESPARDQGSLRSYLDTVLEHRRFVIASVVLCTLVAAAYAFTAHKTYNAQASVLVTPVPATETNVLGLGLLSQATDPTQDTTTATRLIDTPNVAALVSSELGLRESPQSLLETVSVAPVANTSIVSITASSGSPARSMQIANAFASAVVQERTSQLYAALDSEIANLRARISGLTSSGPSNAAVQLLYQQLAALEALHAGPDPTLRVEGTAPLPTGPASPRAKLVVLGGLLAGLLIGIAGAFLLRAFDPRRAREDALAVTGVPILARVPRIGRRRDSRQAFEEAFRALRTTLRFTSTKNPIGVVAVTSPWEQDGKTTASFQLAMASLEAGQTVLLVEADPFAGSLQSLVGVDGESSDSSVTSPAGPTSTRSSTPRGSRG